MDLWRNFIKGDRLAFDSLMQQHINILFCYGCKFSKDEELVKDAIQELFIRIWETRLNLCSDVKPKPYLMASLRRLLHRKIKRDLNTVPFSSLDDNSIFFDVEMSVEQRYIQNERLMHMAIQIGDKISSLPERQKEVVYLKFFMNISRDEICEIMNIRPQTVSNLLQAALKKLRGELVLSPFSN